VRPRSIAHRQSDIHAEEHAQEQFSAFQPVRDALWCVAGDGRGRGGIWHRVSDGRRRRSRARSQGRRSHFRLLGHSLLDLPSSIPVSICTGSSAESLPGARTTYCNGNTAGASELGASRTDGRQPKRQGYEPPTSMIISGGAWQAEEPENFTTVPSS
jgi:hypothetical protein